MTDKAELDRLSGAATQGEWQHHLSHIYGPDPERELIAQFRGTSGGHLTADRDFTLALVNAYRAGEIVHAATVAGRIERLEAAAEVLRKEAAILLQNAEGCAVSHYGHDPELHGMPSWLADSRHRIEEAARALQENDNAE